MTGKEKNGTNLGRRDFIKTTTMAVVGSTLASTGLNAKETGIKVPETNDKVRSNMKKLLCLSEFPEMDTKLIESLKADNEIGLNINLIKVDYRDPPKLMETIKEKNTGIILMCLPFMTFSFGRLAQYLGDLDTPILLYSPNTDLIMINANFAAELREKGANIKYTNSERELIDILKRASEPGILDGKKALIFGRPFNSTSIPAHNLTEEYVYNRTGLSIQHRPLDDLKTLLEKIDKEDAKKEMERWKKEAKAVDKVSKKVLLDECRMYILLRSIIDKEGLSAISIDCLRFTLFGQDPVLPLPCLAVSRLRDEGITASCEGDICGLLSSMVFEKISGKPSYFANVASVDRQKSCTVLRHCVAPLKLFGPDQLQLPYELHDYHGLGKGVVPRVDFPAGMEVTMGAFTKDLKSFVLWPGITCAGVDDLDKPFFPPDFFKGMENMPKPKPEGMNIPFPPNGHMESYCANRVDVKIRDVDRFFQNITGIHNVMIAGNYMKEISEAMAVKNVNIIGPIDTSVS